MVREPPDGPAPPAISIVIASWCDEQRLLRCLESVASQCHDAEVIVATSLPEAALQRVQHQYAFVRASSHPGATVFRLRTLGALRATGRLVALIEDHVTVGPRWVDAMVTAHGAGHQVVGGPVENGLTSRAFDWALYFVEYGVHMPPVYEGAVQAVSGVNVAYDRDLLVGCLPVWQDTLQENEVNDALAAGGSTPWMAPAAWVASHLPMNLSQAMQHLYEGGRHFGNYRRVTSPLWKRLLWVALSPGVPLILFVRITRRVASRAPGRLWVLAGGLGYFALILGAWSVGEMTGYLRGNTK